jgi:carboxyl-terminal processing protease
MLPASNRGAGMNIGFPDVCNTIVGPATVPIPYPNIAMNAQAAPFSPIVKVSMMPALNMGSMIPMTMGDEAGTAHPTVKGPGRYTMGNPIVFVDGQPAINLTCPTTGNNSNNPLGAVLVPSAVNVFYCDARGGQAMEAAVSHRRLGEVGWVTLRSLPADAPAQVHQALLALEAEGARAAVLDLRGNGGGELDAAVRVAEELLEEGDPIAVTIDGDGDRSLVRARHPQRWALPLVVIVDGTTASAAEVLAAALAGNARALLVGSRTFGKAIATDVDASDDGPVVSSTARLEVRAPDGTSFHARGLSPHVEATSEEVEATALAHARELARG